MNSAIDWAWKQNTTAKEKLVLVYLADKANDEFVCWPAAVKIMADCGLSRASLFRALKGLKMAKLIARRGRNFVIKYHCETIPKVSNRDLKSHSDTQSLIVIPEKSQPETQNHKDPTSNPHRTKKRARDGKGKTKLPDDFQITPEMRDWFRETFGEIPRHAVLAAHDDWLDYIRRDDIRHKDWLAAWRSGMRKAKDWGKFGPDPSAGGNGRKKSNLEGKLTALQEWRDGPGDTRVVKDGDIDGHVPPDGSPPKLPAPGK